MICVADIFKQLLKSVEWMFVTQNHDRNKDKDEEEIKGNEQENNFHEISMYNFEKIKSSVYLLLQTIHSLSGLWFELIKYIDSSGKILSFFDQRPSLLPDYLLPTVSDLLSIVEILREILHYLQYLRKTYFYLSILYCELMKNNPNNLQNQDFDSKKQILESLMIDIESATIDLINGWRSIILVVGSTLINNTIKNHNNNSKNNNNDENQNHFMLTYDSDGFEHQILTSADDITTTIVKTILKYTIQVNNYFFFLSFFSFIIFQFTFTIFIFSFGLKMLLKIYL